jgi:CheY-like chemotaxis protein
MPRAILDHAVCGQVVVKIVRAGIDEGSHTPCDVRFCQRPRQDSNLRSRLRRAVLYPLSYEGSTLARVSAGLVRGVRPALGRYGSYVAESRGRVLVVDDSDVVRQLIAVNLELEGFQVVTAIDGTDCLDRVLEVDPDVITLDVVMPGIDGFRTAELLRADHRTRGYKIVMVTASAQRADLRRGQGIGVDAYLTKPFDPGDLIRTVDALCAQAAR